MPGVIAVLWCLRVSYLLVDMLVGWKRAWCLPPCSKVIEALVFGVITSSRVFGTHVPPVIPKLMS